MLVSRGLVGPKVALNRIYRMGSWSIFQHRSALGTHAASPGTAVAVSNCIKEGKHRHGSNLPKARQALRTEGRDNAGCP